MPKNNRPSFSDGCQPGLIMIMLDDDDDGGSDDDDDVM